MKVQGDSRSAWVTTRQHAGLLWLVAFVLLSVVALLWNALGMNETLVIDGQSAYPVRAVDDRDATHRGNSVAIVRREGRSLELQCQVGDAAPAPFCEMHIALAPESEGIDLRRFSVLRIQLSATGPEPRQRVRLALGNFNPAYSRSSDIETLKNQALVEEHDIPLNFAGAELQHVVAMDIETGSDLLPGMHRIVVERIELQRKLVSPAAFRLGLLLAWLGAAGAYAAIQLLHLKGQVAESRRQQRILARTIASLDARGDSPETLARSDPATGLLNRTGLTLALEQLLRRHGLELFPMAVIFVDIDRFRRINDSLGHAAGDTVIAQMAAHLRSHVTHDDLVARWGGEEFLLLCPGTGEEEARRIAERLRLGMAQRAWPDSVEVSCSFGITTLAAGEDWLKAIERADDAMYRAKQAGRNRVVMVQAA